VTASQGHALVADRAGRSRAGLAGVLGATGVVMMSNTLLTAALPQLSAALRASESQLSWMVDTYALVLAGFLIPAGALGDRYGRRGALVLGLAVIVVSNAVALGWHDPGVVIASRGLAGLGAAMAFPATLSTIMTALPEEQRARGVALWATVVGLAGFLGILVSGALVEVFYAFSVFLFGMIAAAAGLALVVLFVPDSARPSGAKLDAVGVVLALAAVAGVMTAVTEQPEHGWASAYVIAGAGVGVAGTIAFVAWELHRREPLLDVRLFRLPGMNSGCVAVIVSFFCFYGLFFLGIQYLQDVRGYGSLVAALAFLPVAVWFPVAPRVVTLVRRFGSRSVLTSGLLCTAAGYLICATLDAGSSYVVFAVGLGVIGVSMVIVMPPATMAIVQSAPTEKQGVASALNDLARQLGAAFGVAVIGAIFNTAFRAHLAGSGGKATLGALGSLLAGGGSVGQAAVVKDAFMSGFRLAMVVCAAALVLGAVVAAIRTPGRADGPAAQPGERGTDQEAISEL
jgi:MFS family permease